MTSRKTLIDQAIRFQNPRRIPLWFVNADQTEGDVMVYHLSLNRPDGSGDNEWGYHLEKRDDGTMGHPTAAHLPDWQAAEGFHAPPPREADRMAGLPEFLDACGDRYRLASLDLSGFTVYTLLRGFENSMVDFLTEPERFAWLMDMIVDFECEMTALAARRGFHGIHFADDWGTQSGLMISPKLWRALFKPRYRRQFDLAHQLGLHVWYHCCGNFGEIVDDFHELGADVLNISQPNVMDIAAHRPAAAGPAVLSAAHQLPDRLHPRHRGRDLCGGPTAVRPAGHAGRRPDRLRRGVRLHGHVAGELSGLRRGLPPAPAVGRLRLHSWRRDVHPGDCRDEVTISFLKSDRRPLTSQIRSMQSRPFSRLTKSLLPSERTSSGEMRIGWCSRRTGLTIRTNSGEITSSRTSVSPSSVRVILSG